MKLWLIMIGGLIISPLALTQEKEAAKEKEAALEIVARVFSLQNEINTLSKKGEFLASQRKVQQVKWLLEALAVKHPKFRPDFVKEMQEHATEKVDSPLIHNFEFPVSNQSTSNMPILVDQNQVNYAAKTWTPRSDVTFAMPVLKSEVSAENIVIQIDK